MDKSLNCWYDTNRRWIICFRNGFGCDFSSHSQSGLGVIADRIPVKQVMLRWFTIVGAGATILLGGAIILPMEAKWVWLAVMFFYQCGANAAGVFYNSLLPHICETDEELDRVSTKAFMYGYVGGGLLLPFILV